MSIWTLVNAQVRIDHFGDCIKSEIEKELGEISTFEEPCCTIIPKGSEGSLEYTIIDHKDEHCLDRYIVSVYGNLRDYNHEREIRDWFNNFLKKFDIRQAVLQINIQDDTYIYVWSDSEERLLIR